MFRRLTVIGLLSISVIVFAFMFETSTAEARRGCRGRRASRSRVSYAPTYYSRPRVSVGVGFYGGHGGYGHGYYGGYGGYGHGGYGHGFYGGYGGY